ncbi:MAG: TRAP transporter small permease subunit [Sulfolobales archaeon]|nr:TRAP transporter small permease subunit [Sulfolobales archaeon]MDW7969845.1 TRAP transporter small permease subunit [Sulfolobales archaeon]
MSNKLNSFLKFVDKALTAIEIPIVVVCGTLLIGLLLYAALGRYFFHIGVPYEDELSRLFFTWLSLLGASYLLRSGEHPTVSLISDRVIAKRKRLGKFYQTFIYLSIITFLVIMLYATLDVLPLYYNYYTTVLRAPMIYYYYAGVVGLSFMIVRYFMKAVTFVLGD